MNVHGVGRILTFGVDDFARCGIEELHPSAAGAQIITLLLYRPRL
jgi:hypothetical protein